MIGIKKHSSSKTHVSAREKRDNISGMIMVLPGFIMFCCLVLYPTVWALKYIFYEYDGFTKASFTGFDNIIRLFTREETFWKAVLFTFKFALCKLVIEFPLALALGTLLNTKILKTRSLFRGIYYMPIILSSAVISTVFTFIFSPYNGILNSLLIKLGIISQNVDWLASPKTAFGCCLFLSIWGGFGNNTILIISGLQNIPHDIYESADIDGANAVTKFFKITLPMLAPVLKTVFMLMIIGALGSYESIFVMTGGGPNHATEVMALSVYNQFFKASGVADYGYGATMGLCSAIVIGIISSIYLRMSKKLDEICD